MPRLRLEDTKEWQLADKSHDVRGRELRDSVGRALGTIKTMMVDTDAQRIESVVLENGTEYPVRDLQIMEQAVYYIPSVAAPPAPAPEPPAPPYAPPAAETAAAETAAAETAAAETAAYAPPAPPFPPYTPPPPAAPVSDPALDAQREEYTERVVPPAPASTYGPPDDYRVESPAVPPPAPPAAEMADPAVPPPAPPADETAYLAGETAYPAEPYAEPVGPGDYVESADRPAPVTPGTYVDPVSGVHHSDPVASGNSIEPIPPAGFTGTGEGAGWDRGEPVAESSAVQPVEPLTEPGPTSAPYYAGLAPEPAFPMHTSSAEDAVGPDAHYRAHFQEHFADTGYAYDDVADAYRFGAEAADDPTLGDADDERLRERFNARYGYRPDDRWGWMGARRAVRYGYDRRRNG